ncbi:MAG: hypothetical protein GXP27_10395, partial [Planctomycetes bacterium]|nr:hypothetical protein [Planctomycetota bacterium]
ATLELYETLLPDLRQQREQWVRNALLPALAPVADVQFSRAVFRAEDAQAVVAEYERNGAEALLVLCLTYAPSQTLLPALQGTRLPILVWNTQEIFGVGGKFDSPAMVANHGVHGTQDLSNVLCRAGVQFQYVTSHLQDADGLEELSDFFVAASAVAGLSRARLGLMGYPFPGMGDFAVDTTHLVATLGCQWTALSVEDYILRAAAAPAASVKRLAAEYRQAYDVANDVSDKDLEMTARAELALREIVREQKLDAFSYQFMAFGEDERTETLPFVAASRLMADGVGFAGEGDMVGAAGTWLLNRLRGPATFSEIFTIDFEGNGLFLSHMGEANVAMARSDRKVRLVARPHPITRTRGKQLALVTCLEPGPATLCALTLGPEHRWRLIASPMSIADFGPLESMVVPHFKLIPRAGDVRDWLSKYARLGGPHHHAVCFGDATRRIRIAAKLLGAEFFEV